MHIPVWLKKINPLLLVLLAFAFFWALNYLIAGSPTEKPKDYAKPSSSIATTNNNKKSKETPEFKLAALHTNDPTPTPTVIAEFKGILNQLSNKCEVETTEKMSDYIYIAWEKINEHKKQSLLDTTRNINASIPEGLKDSLKCMEVAAAYATIKIMK